VAVTANHEINQPLMIAKGNLEMMLMRMGDLPDNTRKHADRLLEAIERIERILLRFRSSTDVQFTDYSASTEMAVLIDEKGQDDK